MDGFWIIMYAHGCELSATFVRDEGDLSRELAKLAASTPICAGDRFEIREGWSEDA